MNLNPREQAVMLLTVSLGKPDKSGTGPLSTREWARFAVWLKEHDLDPSALLKGDVKDLLTGWKDQTITLSRLSGLLDRGVALGLALEKWQRAGLWIMTRSDPAYPKQLKHHLKVDSPPVLVGCGNKRLLDQGGIAVVGSRKAEPEDLEFADQLGRSAAKQGHVIISGGARGVDESAMLGTLENEGTAIGVLANNLLRATTSKKYRNYLGSGDLVLISPFNPEAGFNVGNAMSRNRYIYCLSDAAIVVSSTLEKGGTWGGAIENVKNQWVPLWVKSTEEEKPGNSALVAKGARWMSNELTSLDYLFNSRPTTTSREGFDCPAIDSEVTERDNADTLVAERTPEQGDMNFYDFFLGRMHDITNNCPINAKEIALRLELREAQVNTWLKRGIGDGKIKKLTRPVRYQLTPGTTDKQRRLSLFGKND